MIVFRPILAHIARNIRYFDVCNLHLMTARDLRDRRAANRAAERLQAVNHALDATVLTKPAASTTSILQP